MKKQIFIGCFIFLAVLGIVNAKSLGRAFVTPQAAENSPEDYSKLTKKERMDMLSDLKDGYMKSGYPKAAKYIENQMNMLENK